MEQPIHDHEKVAVAVAQILAAVALVSLALFSPYALNYGFLKTAIFQTATIIMAAIGLSLAFFNPSFRRTWRSPLFLAVTIFTALVLIATPFASDPYRSFWSSLQRMAGGVNHLHWWLWLAALITINRTREDWARLMSISAATAVMAGVYGLAVWSKEIWEGRLISTFGNPSFFGSYIMMNVFMAAAVTTLVKSRRLKISVAAAGIFLLVIAVLTASRSVVLGLVVGGVGVLIVARRWRKGIAVATAIALLLVISTRALMMGPLNAWSRAHGSNPVVRLITANLGADRATLATVSFAAIAERPWFGWGAEGFRDAYERHYELASVDRTMDRTWADRPHNQFLGVWVSFGFFAFLGYLAIWLLAFREIRKTSEKTGLDRLGLSVAGGALAAFAIYTSFNFDGIYVTPLFYLFLAFIIYMKEDVRPDSGRRAVSAESLIVVSSVLGLAGVAVAVYINWLPFMQVASFAKALNLLSVDRQATVVAMTRVFAKDSFVSAELGMVLADAVRIAGQQLPTPDEDVADLARLAGGVLQDDGLSLGDYKKHLLAAQSWRVAANFSAATDDVERARNLLATLVEISPARPEAYLELAEVAMTTREHIDAAKYLEQARERAANWRMLAQVSFAKAVLSAQVGDWSSAASAYAEAVAEARRSNSPLSSDVSIGDGIDPVMAFLPSADPSLALPLALVWPEGEALPDIVRNYYDGLEKPYSRCESVWEARIILALKLDGEMAARSVLSDMRRVMPKTAERVEARVWR